MGNDLQKGTTYATGGVGGQGSITSANLNAHVDDAVIKPTFVSTKAARAPGTFTDNILLESGGALYRMLLSTLYDLLVPPGSVIQTAYSEYTANTNITASIPTDDTIPQNTEGIEILSVPITPRLVTSTILAVFNGQVFGTATAGVAAAMFRDSIANAIVATNATIVAATLIPEQLVLRHMDSPGTTSMTTYKIRVGTTAGTMRLNGTASARVFGGVSKATLTLQEIKV